MGQFELPDWDRDNFKLIKEEKRFGYRKRRFELPDICPVAGFDEPITLDLYHVRKGAPTIIIHPILGGENRVARAFAGFFTRVARWNAVVQHRARRPYEYGSLEGIESGLVNIVMNTLQCFDWLEYHGHLKRERSLSMGTSLGALSNALLTANVPARGFIHIMGGGPLSHILSHSQESAVVRWREATMEEHCIDQAELEQRLEEIIQTDPLAIAKKSNAARVKMFIALYDKSVPTEDQLRLSKAYPKRSDTSKLPAGHTSMAWFLPYLMAESWRWGRKVIK